MAKLLKAYEENPTPKTAQKVRDYYAKHPMSACMLDAEQTYLLKNAMLCGVVLTV